MIFIKLLIAVIFAISTLLVFDTRNIVKRYFMIKDKKRYKRNKRYKK